MCKVKGIANPWLSSLVSLCSPKAPKAPKGRERISWSQRSEHHREAWLELWEGDRKGAAAVWAFSSLLCVSKVKWMKQEEHFLPPFVLSVHLELSVTTGAEGGRCCQMKNPAHTHKALLLLSQLPVIAFFIMIVFLVDWPGEERAPGWKYRKLAVAMWGLGKSCAGKPRILPNMWMFTTYLNTTI